MITYKKGYVKMSTYQDYSKKQKEIWNVIYRNFYLKRTEKLY